MENEDSTRKYLVFSVEEDYALELSKIVEIIEYRSVTKVPETPAYIAGVMNLHGSVLPVIDMRKRFHKPDATVVTRRCIVVIRYEDMRLGLIVDTVTDLIDIDKSTISPPPQVGKDYSHVFIKAIGVCSDKMVLIIDADTLVNHSDLQFLQEDESPEGEEPPSPEKDTAAKSSTTKHSKN